MADKFKALFFNTMFFSLNWFICLYTDKLPEHIAVPILDVIMIKGNEILHNIGLAILYIIREHILKCETFHDLMELMESHHKYVDDPHKLLYLALKPGEIKLPTKEEIRRLRKKYHDVEVQKIINNAQDDLTATINKETYLIPQVQGGGANKTQA